ncbi:MAG: cache domain-containing protein [Syntrophomonadaceae bacterium]|nr:cache domain-containing protein [Syntrophomonadaceae bacterium]
MAKHSLKTKFIIITCLICLISLLMVSAVSYITSLKIVKSELNQKTAGTVLNNANIIDNWFKNQNTFIDNMAKDIQFSGNYRNYYLQKYLEYKLKQQNQVLDYYIGFTDDRFISGINWLPPSDYDFKTREWYINAINKKAIIYTIPYVDAMTGKMVITIAEPLYNQGEIIGVLAADIMVDNLVELTHKAGKDSPGYAFLLDQQGHFLVTPAEKWQPAQDSLHDAHQVMNGRYLPLFNSKNANNINMVLLQDYDGGYKYFFTTRVNSSNWIFGEAIPKSVYVEPLNKLLFSFIIILLISLLIGSLIILSAINGLINPLNQLRQAVLRFSQKDFTARSQVNSEDEIGDLSKSFNEMAAIIQEYNRSLESMVEARTQELQDKNQNIMESINYSKRIQESILPDLVNYHGIAYDDHFVVWKPRDTVGGDFYWSKQKDDTVFIAIADCTGHGVPGALMTMTVNAILDRIIDEDRAQMPAAILKRLNRILKETLRQDTPDALTNDGADVGLCMIRPDRKEMVYAGSKISLFAYQENEIIQIKGDRQSLGYKRSRLDYEYTDHPLSLDNQMFYLTTDGLLDQNGEEINKSFGITRFKQTLLDMKDLSMDQQKELLLEVLNKYMGCESQRDDITIIGFKI